MIGLTFLAVALLWLALTTYLSIKIPRWLGLTGYLSGLLRLLLVPLLLVGPFVDEIIGMRQFNQLCKDRAVAWVSPEAGQVKQAKSLHPKPVELSGYWIEIESHPVVYIDVDTEQPFYTYETLLTKGGLIGGIVLLGGTHSCEPKDNHEIWKNLNLDQLLNAGKKQ